MPSAHQVHCADRIEEVRLDDVRLHELLHSERALVGPHPILLGDPHHRFSSFGRCGLAKTEVRLARDGHGYIFREFEEWYGKRATGYWERSTKLNPVSKSRGLGDEEKQACHRALLRILRKQNGLLKARKVTEHVLPEHVQQLIANFITNGTGRT